MSGDFGSMIDRAKIRLLIKCSKWIGEGWHLPMLDAILEHGFAPSAIDPPAADQWPSCSDPGWKSERTTPDPFFIDYFATLVNQEPGEIPSGPVGMQGRLTDVM